MIKANTRLGTVTIQIEAENTKDLFKELAFFSQCPTECGNCGSKEIRPSHSTAKGYDFYQMECSACRHELKFGQRKEDGGLFPKHDEGKNGWCPILRGAGGKTSNEPSDGEDDW